MMIMLPPELIDVVFGYCSKDSLTKCALGNQTFLDLARAHLYRVIEASKPLEYAMSCSANTQLFIHTKHIAFHSRFPSYIPFLQMIHQLGRVESISHKSYSPREAVDLKPIEEHVHGILQILSLSTVTRFRLYLNLWRRTEPTPPPLYALLFSPKLRDLHIVHRFTNFPPPRQFSAQKLDTLRIQISHWELFQAQCTTLRRLLLYIHQRVSDLTHLSFASLSHHLTHLALRLERSSDRDPGLCRGICTDLHILTSLTVQIDGPQDEFSRSFQLLWFLVEDIPPAAPLTMIHIIIIPPQLNILTQLLGTWEGIPQNIKEKFPQCRLFIHSRITRSNLSHHLLDVEKVYHIHDIPDSPFFSNDRSLYIRSGM